MARTCRTSDAETAVAWLSFRFRLLGFDVRIWRAPECPRITLPVAVNLKRLAAPLCVFSLALGKSYSLRNSQKLEVQSQRSGNRLGRTWRSGAHRRTGGRLRFDRCGCAR